MFKLNLSTSLKISVFLGSTRVFDLAYFNIDFKRSYFYNETPKEIVGALRLVLDSSVHVSLTSVPLYVFVPFGSIFSRLQIVDQVIIWFESWHLSVSNLIIKPVLRGAVNLKLFMWNICWRSFEFNGLHVDHKITYFTSFCGCSLTELSATLFLTAKVCLLLELVNSKLVVKCCSFCFGPVDICHVFLTR